MFVWHALLHALEDSLKMLPFLFAAYLAIEYIEHKKSHTIERLLAKGGKFGFVPGALLGIIPQCGFSTMASGFYASRVITLGTLMAVFVATSDEAIPLMLAQPESYPAMLVLVVVKLLYALLVGFLIDIVFSRWMPASLRGGYGGKISEVDCHGHDEKENIWLAAIKHTVNIFLYVLAFTFVFGLLVEWLGEAQISAFFNSLGFLQPVVAALFGLIPNCAASVLLTQLYLDGVIHFGSVLAGLCTNAGVGLIVLFRTNRNIKQNLFIVGLLFALGCALGLVVYALGF